MTEFDISQTSVSNVDGTISQYSVNPKTTDGINEGTGETTWLNEDWSEWYGYYKTIPEYKTAINAYATWVIGKGWKADGRTKIMLERITGWGEDTFMSILWNMLVVKKVAGDSYAEIIRNENGLLINLKPLDPGSIRIVVDDRGLVKRYEQIAKSGKKKTAVRKFRPEQILHLCNDRVADNIHGTSITESVKWVIDARNEAMTNWRIVLNRNINPLKIFELDTDDSTKINNFKTQYQNMTKDYEALFVPKGSAEVTIPNVPLQDPQSWIKYLENFFYQALGVPKVILGGSEEFTEASSKIGYLTFEQVYSKEVEELKADLWNQVAIRIEFNKPASIKNELLQSEDKNTGQTGFQPSEATATLTRNE